MNYTPFRWLPGRLQAFIFGAASLFVMPDVKEPTKAIKTFQSEALHFRRGIRMFSSFSSCLAVSRRSEICTENFRCWDTEWEIPVPTAQDGKVDYSLIQRAW